MLYANDSFFTLGTGGQIGLVCLSVLLFAGCVWFVFWFVKGLGRLIRVLVALTVFYLFVWLSPQIYYMYYLVIFDDLPLQLVVKSPPGWRKIFGVMTFAERATLTEHGQAIFWWILAAIALLRRRPKAE
ncbi:hypothetical protein N9M66_05295 [Litoreibacter sp.]|nr:hypothetical protein [Litoreibacter sp.]